MTSLHESLPAASDAPTDSATLETTRSPTSYPPISVLPAELLRAILLLTVAPHEHSSITALASVCSLWRAAILTERSLFSSADWEAWPVWLLQVWCARARGCALTVGLGERGMGMLGAGSDSPEDGRGREYVRLLESTRSAWRSLHVSVPKASGSVLQATRFLFRETLPALHSLHYSVQDADEVSLRLSRTITFSTPNIRTLHLCGIDFLPSHPLTHLVSLTTRPLFDKTGSFQWTTLLRQCPNLWKLTLDSAHQTGSIGKLWDESIELPMLRELDVSRMEAWIVHPVIRAMVCPDLRSVALREMSISRSLFKIMTGCAPRLTQLRIGQTAKLQGGWGAMRILADEPTYLPQLEELLIEGPDQGAAEELKFADQQSYESTVLRLVSGRRLLSMGLPSLTRSCASVAEQYVVSLKVHNWRDESEVEAPELYF